jgi:hypothetical protein
MGSLDRRRIDRCLRGVAQILACRCLSSHRVLSLGETLDGALLFCMSFLVVARGMDADDSINTTLWEKAHALARDRPVKDGKLRALGVAATQRVAASGGTRAAILPST